MNCEALRDIQISSEPHIIVSAFDTQAVGAGGKRSGGVLYRSMNGQNSSRGQVAHSRSQCRQLPVARAERVERVPFSEGIVIKQLQERSHLELL